MWLVCCLKSVDGFTFLRYHREIPAKGPCPESPLTPQERGESRAHPPFELRRTEKRAACQQGAEEEDLAGPQPSVVTIRALRPRLASSLSSSSRP